MSEQTSFHLKYRPKVLDEVIGHEDTVVKLKGMIAQKKFPTAMMFLGPPSAGKTTFAYAFANEVFGGKADVKHHQSFTEINAGDKRSIEEMRELINLARLSPMGAPRRFILIDEFQQLLSNATAASAILKPLEHPPAKTTTWILASMEPERFQSTTTGRAILSRCQQFHLKAPTPDLLRKFAIRIIKGEGLSFMSKESLAKVVEASDSMRVIANNLESLTNHYNGMAKKPDKISADQVTEVLAATESDDDKTAVRFLTALLAGKFVACQKEILSVQDSFGFFNKVLWLNNFLLNNTVLNGERHPKVWTNASGWVFKDNMDKVWEGVERKDRIARLAKVLAFLTKAKAQAGAFQVPEVFLLTTLVYDLTYGESK